MRKKLRRNQSGSATIEFSLTLLIFTALLFFTFEMCRASYVAAVLDIAVSEAAKGAKNTKIKGDSPAYEKAFKEEILNRSGVLWHFLTDADNLTFNVYYANSIQEMIKTGGKSGSSKGKPLARYRLSYKYDGMFVPGFGRWWSDAMFTREVIFVQEYERSRFN